MPITPALRRLALLSVLGLSAGAAACSSSEADPPPANHDPVAVDDTAATAVDVAVEIPVLDDDSDADGDPLSVVSVTQGAHGSVTTSASAVTYTPAAGFSGSDAFTYTIEDGRGGTATATVSVTVEGLAVVDLAGGPNHTCALLNDGRVKCWGTNGYGQLGVGDTGNRGDDYGEMGASLPAAALGTGRRAVALTGGRMHTCALLDDGTVKCWGSNYVGQLGLGDTADRGDGPGEMGDALPPVDLGTGRTAQAVSAGSQHTCALLDDGTVKCWGYGTGGLLGVGDGEWRGGGPGEMGDALPAVDLGTGRTALAIAAGLEHTCALLDDHSLKCWGRGSGGALGNGSLTAIGDAPGEMGDSLVAAALGTGRVATAIAAGTSQSCAVLDDASLKCWGRNQLGQLGLGDTSNRGDGAGEMGDALPAVDVGAGRKVALVSPGGPDGSGDAHTCAILDDGSVRCWGANTYGQLGLGDLAPRGDAAGEMGDALPAVSLGTGRTARTIVAGGSHTCALLDDHSVKCWGSAQFGKLGRPTTDRGDGPGEMGDALLPVPIF